jgi:two-component system sensor histidine kinase UhpB
VSAASIHELAIGPVASLIPLPKVKSGGLSDRRKIKEALARELHDQLAQNMTSLLVQTQVFARDQQDRPDVLAELGFVQTSIREMLNNLRQILCELRDQPGLSKGLIPAIREGLIPGVESRADIKVSLWVSRAWPASMPPDTSIHIYRIIQEALNNACKHGAATRAHVALRYVSAEMIVITVSDNGRGIAFVDEDKPIGMGLLGMRERAAILGGALTIRSRPRGGTTITARLKKEALTWSPKPALFAS